jgi:hypothetical protein
MKTAAVIAILLMGASALAVPVDADDPNGIAAVMGYSGTFLILCTDGQMYALANPESESAMWEPFTYSLPLPVPLADIADFGIGRLETNSGEHWIYVSTEYGPPPRWLTLSDPALPRLPCAATVRVDGSALGAVKSLFR